MELTAEQKLAKSKALERTWKSREDYISDLRLQHPYIYNTWRSFKFTEKGKKIGNSKEWDDFNKDNFIWVTSKEASVMHQVKVFLEFNGNAYTIEQASREFGIPKSSIKNRYYKHPEYTTEEIIFGKKRNRGSKQVKDASESDNVRSKTSKMVSSYRCKDSKNGISICDIDIDWMIDNIITAKCYYCGDGNKIGCDRIDNTKGHTKDNVVPCCYECNCARNNNFTVDEMKVIGAAIRKVKESRI